jgi:hypothetical protein
MTDLEILKYKRLSGIKIPVTTESGEIEHQESYLLRAMKILERAKVFKGSDDLNIVKEFAKELERVEEGL